MQRARERQLAAMFLVLHEHVGGKGSPGLPGITIRLLPEIPGIT